MTLALHVSKTVELGGKDTCRANGTEYQKIEDEDKLIDNGNTRHSGGGDASHHDVVQQIDQIGNAVLDHHGKGYGKHRVIKFSISDITAQDFWLGHEAPHR